MFSGQWFFRHRGTIVSLPLLIALFWRHREALSLALAWGVGLALLFAGMALRIWAQSFIHHRLKVPLELTTGGPYQLVRNPLYIGNILICASAAFLANLPWLSLFIVIWCIGLYSVVTRYEETRLVNLYGSRYESYWREVPRWFPRLKGIKHIAFWNDFSLRAVRAELHCLLIGLIFALKGLADSPAWHVTLAGLQARLF